MANYNITNIFHQPSSYNFYNPTTLENHHQYYDQQVDLSSYYHQPPSPPYEPTEVNYLHQKAFDYSSNFRAQYQYNHGKISQVGLIQASELVRADH